MKFDKAAVASILCALALATFVEPTKAGLFNDLQPVKKQRQQRALGCPVGEWIRNNHHTNNERFIGYASSKDECVDLVENNCPNANIANLAEFPGTDCWCQYHDGSDANGNTLTQLVTQTYENYESCLLSLTPTDASTYTPTSSGNICQTLSTQCLLSSACNVWTGGCTSTIAKKTDLWCDDFCYAAEKGDCCEINPGPVAGIAIGVLFVVVFTIIGICACCKCCCFRKPEVVVMQAPSV